MSRMALVIGAVLMLLPTPSPGQALARSLGGDYILTYTDLNDTLRTVEIEATDQVQPTTTVQVTGSGGLFVYRYVLANGSTARRALAFLDVPCPAADPMLAATGPTSWNAKAGVSGKLDGIGGLKLCSFSFRDDLAEVLPGTTLIGLQITSTWLPALRTARAYGLVETVLMPTSHEDTPDTVYTLVDRAQGFGFFTGGGLGVPVVAPVRPPAALADPGPGLDSVATDLSQSCDLGWITDPSTCAALAARLDQARQALSQGNATGARAGVESFLVSLNGAHGPGLPVNDNAFWLLTVNAEFIRDLLSAGGGSVTLPVAADTYLRSGSPNQNQGTEPILRLRASGNNRALLRLDSAAVATAAGSGTVTSARLELTIALNADNWGSTGRTLDLHRLTQSWTEAGATWNCGDDLEPDNQRPDCPLTAWEMGGAGPHPWVATPTATRLITNGLRGVITFDVTADVQAMLGAGSHPGWILKKTAEGPSGRVEFGSRESATPPLLILEIQP